MKNKIIIGSLLIGTIIGMTSLASANSYSNGNFKKSFCYEKPKNFSSLTIEEKQVLMKQKRLERQKTNKERQIKMKEIRTILEKKEFEKF